MTEAEHVRRTRLVVDIVWRGHPDGRELYYDEAERVTVARDWIEGAFEDRDDSPEVTVTAVGGASADRGRDSGGALTSVRTVLSRAETALGELGPEGAKTEWPPRTGDFERDDYFARKAGKFEDPDAPAMRQALRAAVALLSPWRKTGRTTRSTCL
ncbi:hypothetical protein [Streptomyces sp. NPDC001781]